jgi:hypothetical protein
MTLIMRVIKSKALLRLSSRHAINYVYELRPVFPHGIADSLADALIFFLCGASSPTKLSRRSLGLG